jgi:ribonuclease P/MRP protein subunit RPP1
MQNYRIAALASAYDLLAVRPTTDKAFQAACLSMTEISLISMDLSAQYSFHFRPKPCMTAVTRGVRFEICYGQALSSTDPRSRANFISNTMALIRSTKGRGIVLSSEARDVLGIRAPADVINLMAVWGLGTERGTEALGINPRGVVVNEGLKRSSFRGVVNIVQVAGRPDDQSKTLATQQAGKGGEKNAPIQKRKTLDQSAGDDKVPEPPMSKRQAKKLRLAQRDAVPKKGAS